MPYRVTRNLDSNYVPIEGHKNESLMFFLQIWFQNIKPIPHEHCTQNQTFGKKYVSGKLFTRLNRYEIVLKRDLWSPFRQ